MDRKHIYFLSPDGREKIRFLTRQPKPVTAQISLDLGLSLAEIRLPDRNTLMVNEKTVSIPDDILNVTDERTIFIYKNENWQKWQLFDKSSEKYYKMVSVGPGVPPTIEISGIKMHITKDSDPEQDTHQKLASLKQFGKRVLDTCMGLGYTAIASASRPETEKIICCDRDINVFRLCRENPWSQTLFESPKIQLLIMPVQELVTRLPDNYLDTVIHDPPRYSLAPELYTKDFYQEIFRVLKNKGGFYHYTGDPHRQSRRISLAKKTGLLLREVGFRRVKQAYAGVVALK